MRPSQFLAAVVMSAGAVFAQSNDVPLSNGSDVAFTYSDPSIGAPTGTVPPDLNGDLYWTVLPGDRVLYHETDLGAFVEIDGYLETIWDTHWTTSPDFYDRSHGSALPGINGTLEPAFFQQGWTNEVLVSLGPSGFGNPCTIFPSICSPPGSSCLPPGFINGFVVDLKVETTPGTGIIIPADGTSASDHAVTWFLSGGMTAIGGPCGLGDYTIQDLHSYDETIVGLPDGTNPYGGLQVAGSGPIPELATHSVEAIVTFRDRMLNVFADSGKGLGIEVGENGGGAKNAMRLSVGSGLAKLGVEIRSQQDAGTVNIAAVGASFSKLGSPGIPVLGANLLITPTPVFNLMLSAWAGSVTGAVLYSTTEGVFTGPLVAVPISTVGVDMFMQGFVLDLGTGAAANTNVWRTTFFP